MDDELRPTALPISLTEGGYPRFCTEEIMKSNMAWCRSVSIGQTRISTKVLRVKRYLDISSDTVISVCPFCDRQVGTMPRGSAMVLQFDFFGEGYSVITQNDLDHLEQVHLERHVEEMISDSS